MARLLSAGMIKGVSHPHGAIPAGGTKLRLLYDVLYEHRGCRIPLSEYQALTELLKEGTVKKWLTPSSLFPILRDQYGCDIRDRSLVGEWFGRVYVDYTAPAEEQAAALSLEDAPLDSIVAARDALLGSRLGGTGCSSDLAGSRSAHLG